MEQKTCDNGPCSGGNDLSLNARENKESGFSTRSNTNKAVQQWQKARKSRDCTIGEAKAKTLISAFAFTAHIVVFLMWRLIFLSLFLPSFHFRSFIFCVF